MTCKKEKVLSDRSQFFQVVLFRSAVSGKNYQEGPLRSTPHITIVSYRLTSVPHAVRKAPYGKY